MAGYAMSDKLLRKFVEAELTKIKGGDEQRFSYLVEGPHGIGKSAFWKEVCLDHNGYFIDIRLGQRDLGDIIGMPSLITEEDGSTRMIHIKPDLIRKMFVNDLSELGTVGDYHDVLSRFRPADKVGKPYEFVLCFLDEYNRGSKDVQQAAFELVYDRRMNGEKVHPKTLIAAACNDNIEIYTITEGDPAFRSRFKTIKYSPTVEEWIDWGKTTGELCDEIIFVMQSNKQLADPPKNKVDDVEYLNQPHKNRRSWTEFSKFYSTFKAQFSEREMKNICATFVGGEGSDEFFNLLSKMKEVGTAKVSEKNENEKINEFYKQFVFLRKIDIEAGKQQLDNFNVSEMQLFADECIKEFSGYSFITAVTRERIVVVAGLLQDEVFTRIWKETKQDHQFRDKMIAHVSAKGQNDFFSKYEVHS